MSKFIFEVVREERRILPIAVEAADRDAAYDILNKALSTVRSDVLIHSHLDSCDSNSETEIQDPYDDTSYDDADILQLSDILQQLRKEY